MILIKETKNKAIRILKASVLTTITVVIGVQFNLIVAIMFAVFMAAIYNRAGVTEVINTSSYISIKGIKQSSKRHNFLELQRTFFLIF